MNKKMQICFIYDEKSQNLENACNGKRLQGCMSYHLAIPNILKKRGVNVIIKTIKDIDNIDFFYYILTFEDVRNVLSHVGNVFQLLDPAIYRAILNNKCKLILNNAREASPAKRASVLLPKHLKRLNLPQNNVFFIGCGEDDKKNNYLSFNYFEAVVQHMLWNDEQNFLNLHALRDKQINQQKLTHRFLCLNRVPRPMRVLFAYLCWKKKLLQDVNLSMSLINADFASLVGLREFGARRTIRSENQNIYKHINYNEFKKFLSTLPYYVDRTDLKTNCWNQHSDNLVLKNGIYIVTETVIDNMMWSKTHGYVTEKTFKPILYQMPFIHISKPGTLKYLKSLGYKTFNSLWCEDYDDIISPAERVHKVITLVENINKQDENEFYVTLKKAQEIALYNFEVFKRRQPENILLQLFNIED